MSGENPLKPQVVDNFVDNSVDNFKKLWITCDLQKLSTGIKSYPQNYPQVIHKSLFFENN